MRTSIGAWRVPALAVAAGTLLFPAEAGAHPIAGGPASSAQIALTVAGLGLALAGWFMVARSRRGRSGPSRFGYALLLAGLLVFLGGPDLIGSIAAYRAGPPPPTRARLEVVEPRDGQVVPSSHVSVGLRVLQPADGGVAWSPVSLLSPTQGHIHVYVDGRLVSMSLQPSLVVQVPPGRHAITVEYVASDHRSFSPPVVVRRQITIQPVSAPAAALGWSDWSWDPPIVVGLGLTILGYVWVARRFPPRRWQRVYFGAGILALVIALLSPLDAGSAYLFTLHMIQHMLLVLVAPPLLALAIPPALLGRLYQQPRLARALRVVWSPSTSLILFNGVLVFWHLPFAYDATLRSAWVHAGEHLSFVVAGMIFWGVIVSPAPKLVRASYGLRLGLVVGANLVNFIVGFALAFAGRPLYRHYTEVARLWGLTPLDDLRLGGGVMWVMGQMMYVIPLLLLLNVLLRREGVNGPPAFPNHGSRRSPPSGDGTSPSITSVRP
jgi:cytochrome c oxidase assembly factor CtaG